MIVDKNWHEVEKESYNNLYKETSTNFIESDQRKYMQYFESYNMSPFYHGGHTKGYVRGKSVHLLIDAASKLKIQNSEITILDAGCGQGELSVYLACKGFNVIGVDISKEASIKAERLAQNVGVADQCRFLPESLEQISIDDSSVDFIIGHAALHHFIKYKNVPNEFHRVMKKSAEGFFADSFGENKVYHLFHDKDKMYKLGDVILNRHLISNFFNNFKVKIIPTDWFVMLDKLYLKFIPKKYEKIMQKISKVHFYLDRKISPESRVALFLSGAVLTTIKKTS